MSRDSGLTGENIFISIYAMCIGAYSAGLASLYGPDLGKAKKAAIKILTIIETPT